jgi:antirestriction protein ArdC
LHNSYSANNTLLIAHQAFIRGIEPTYVAGFRAWLSLGRCVRKGETGLTIWAPMRVKVRDAGNDGAADGTGVGEGEKRKTIFRTTAVFDVSQTDPLPDVEPAPLEAPSLGTIEGDSHIGLIRPLEELARGLGYQVVWAAEIRGGAHGLCRRGRERQIEVLTSLAANHGVAVLIHEICHAFVGERDELRSIDRRLEEIVVESATYIACACVGLQTDVDSVPYVAGWAGTEDPVAVVQQAAGLIDELARLIEDAIAPADDDEQADGGAAAPLVATA